MWVWVVVCPYMSALQQTGDLSRVYPTAHPVTAGISSSTPRDPAKDKRYRKWLTDLKTKEDQGVLTVMDLPSQSPFLIVHLWGRL